MHRDRSAAARGAARWSAHARRFAAAVERLEWRQLLSVSQDVDGWTRITPPGDAHVIYVSSSAGNDQNSGFSATSPVRTISHGISLLRAKAADQLLLASGDVWDESLGIWERSGLAKDQPMVIGAYGTGARPLLRTGGFAFRIHSGGGVSHVALLGLHLQHTGTIRADGLSITGKADDLLVEDCLIEQYQNNIIAEASHGTIHDVRIRRSVIVDAHNYELPKRMNSEGAFFEEVQSLLLEQNVFDHNGWAVPSDATIYNHNVYIRSTCTGVEVRGNLFANASSHGLQARSGGVIENNVFLNNPIGLSFGLVNSGPVTPGGVSGRVKDNVFIGGGSINGDERGNGVEVANTRPQGNAATPTLIYNNLFTHGKIASSNSSAIRVASGFSMTNTWDAVGINDLLVKNNKVYNWGVGLEILKGLHTGLDVATGKANHDWNLAHPNETPRDDKWPWSLSNLQVQNNDFQQIASYLVQHDAPIDPIVPVKHKPILFSENRYNGTGAVPFTTLKELLSDVRIDLTRQDWIARVEPGTFGEVGYPDPERSVGSYNAKLGGAETTAAFISAARQQSGEAWDVRLTAAAVRDYLFGGFGMTADEPVVISPPPPAIDPPDTTPPAPTAELPTASHVWALGHQLKLSVTYRGGSGINHNTIDNQDVSLTSDATSGIAPATAVAIADNADGSFTATYTFNSPNGKWRKADEGAFTLSLIPDQVKDSAGSAVTAAPATFAVHVGRTPKPAVVKKARLKTGTDGIQRLTIKFSADVHTIDALDLSVTPSEGTQQPLDSSQFQVSYDPAKHVATFAFPSGQVAGGSSNFTLHAAGIVDVWGRPLDGNRDRVPGGDWMWNTRI